MTTIHTLGWSQKGHQQQFIYQIKWASMLRLIGLIHSVKETPPKISKLGHRRWSQRSESNTFLRFYLKHLSF